MTLCQPISTDEESLRCSRAGEIFYLFDIYHLCEDFWNSIQGLGIQYSGEPLTEDQYDLKKRKA